MLHRVAGPFLKISSGGGGMYRKGPCYYILSVNCEEMTDGCCMVTKRLVIGGVV